MATKKLKHRYVQGFGIVVMVLALARCVFPGIAGKQGAVSVAPEDSTVLNTETAMAEKADSIVAVKAEAKEETAKVEKAETAVATQPETEVTKPSTAEVTKPVTAEEKPATAYSGPLPSAGKAVAYITAGQRPHPILSVHSYAEAFPDSNHVQLEAARQWGVSPVKNREDAEMRKNEVVYVGSSPYYDMAHLDASIPYLVPRASVLLQDIGRTFFDSLQVKGLPLHRIVVSSVLRTEEDVARLRRSNHNATEQSCHLYGTTFDINYNIYTAVTQRETPSDKLKFVLSEVLNDLRKQGRCYIKYEVRQPCFHITVR